MPSKILAESHLRTLSNKLLGACKKGSLSTVRSTAPILYPFMFSTSISPAVVPPLQIPLATAARHGQAKILRYLLTTLPACSGMSMPWQPQFDPASPTSEKEKSFLYADFVISSALHSPSTEVMQTLLDFGMDVDYQMDKSGPPLSSAITIQNLTMVKFLLSKGADPNGIEFMTFIPFLASAAQKSSLDIMKALMDNGATLEGSGALYTAGEKGNIKAAELLLQRGFDINELIYMEYWGEENGHVGTALHAAAEYGQIEMLRFLLKRGARTDLKNGDDQTPRELADWFGHTDVVRILDTYN